MNPFGPSAGHAKGSPPVLSHIVSSVQSPSLFEVKTGTFVKKAEAIPAVYSPLILFVATGPYVEVMVLSAGFTPGVIFHVEPGITNLAVL